MKKVIDWVTIKFLIVGVINTLVGSAVMFLLYNGFHTGYWIASACNYIIGSIVSYFLNKYFTFRSKEKSLREVITFAVNIVICYVLASQSHVYIRSSADMAQRYKIILPCLRECVCLWD